MIAILAFGSLVTDPGPEIAPLIQERRKVTTPFCVEYARLSESRGMGPTIVPVSVGGSHVAADVLVLDPAVTLTEAKNLLFRRETRQERTGRAYVETEDPPPGKVLVRVAPAFAGCEGLAAVLYVDFPPEGKLVSPTADLLAQRAIASVRAARTAPDGISYLIAARESGILTPLTPGYEAAILAQTHTAALADALAFAAQPAC